MVPIQARRLGKLALGACLPLGLYVAACGTDKEEGLNVTGTWRVKTVVTSDNCKIYGVGATDEFSSSIKQSGNVLEWGGFAGSIDESGAFEVAFTNIATESGSTTASKSKITGTFSGDSVKATFTFDGSSGGLNCVIVYELTGSRSNFSVDDSLSSVPVGGVTTAGGAGSTGSGPGQTDSSSGATPAPLPDTPGMTREKPVPTGTSLLLPEGWEMKVVSSTPDATSIVLAENRYNDPPKSGFKFMIVRVSAKNVSAKDPAKFDASFALRLVGSKGVGYTTFGNSCGVIPDKFPVNDIYRGGGPEGNVCYEVAQDEKDFVLFTYNVDYVNSGEKERRYFAVP